MNAERKLTEPAGRPLLWLDYVDYAAALLAGGPAPWLNTADCVAWLRKAQGLLQSGVITLPLDAVARAWVSAHADLRQAMAARKKVGFPLKTLLGNEALRGYLVELLGGLRASFGGATLALTCPAPGSWLVQTYADAFSDVTEVDDDAVDSAAVHIADFLRVFGQSGIDALLLDDSVAAASVDEARLALYQPIFNVCGHYRWDAGLLTPDGVTGGVPTDMTFVVTRAPTRDGRGLTIVPESFWSAGELVGESGRRLYVRIPADGVPEAVLQRLSALR
ncbi:MAG: hypothetical protein E6Q40_06980 [Cupriavidus sp.]|nr:MAG: hypothetical protein E6Q40_06980 [Cupriavidus sp.]